MRKKIDQKARQRWYFYTIYIRVGGDGSVLYEKERVLSGGEGSLREREVKRCLASPGNKITLKYFFARFSRQLFFFFFYKNHFYERDSFSIFRFFVLLFPFPEPQLSYGIEQMRRGKMQGVCFAQFTFPPTNGVCVVCGIQMKQNKLYARPAKGDIVENILR